MDPKEVLAIRRGTKENDGEKPITHFKANKFKETVSITEEILVYDPSNKEARDLTNASYYQMGKGLNQEKKYQEALGAVQPG